MLTVWTLLHLYFIHASLRRATRTPQTPRTPRRNFYPRFLCGERQAFVIYYSGYMWPFIHAYPFAESDGTQHAVERRHKLILSTPSLRRATTHARMCGTPNRQFFIHASFAESDIMVFCGPQGSEILSTPPCGERHNANWSWPEYFNHFIHALLCGERRAKSFGEHYVAFRFSIHASLCGERPR